MKLITKIVGATLGLALAVGVGFGVANNKNAGPVYALETDTYTMADVISTSYGKYENSDFIVTCGGGGSTVGVNNNATNWGKLNLSSYSKYAVSPVSTSDYATAVVMKKSTANVSTMTFAYTSGTNCNKGSIYAIYSSDNTTYSQLTITSGTSQGYTFTGNSSTCTFNFAACTGYFGIVIKLTGSLSSGSNWKYTNCTLALSYQNTPAAELTGLRIYSGEESVKKEYDAGDSFDPTGLVIQAKWDDAWDTENNVLEDVSWSPEPLTAGTTSVTGTYFDKVVVINGLTVTAPDIVLDKDNTPFTSTNGTNTSEENVALGGIEYHNLAGYNYNSYLSFNRNQSGAYLANNTAFAKNIAKIVVNYNSGGSNYFTMYEGMSASAETYVIEPGATGTGKITYTFNDENQYFKFKLSTTGTYCNINSISIFYGSTHTEDITVNTVSAEVSGTHYAGTRLVASDFSLTVTWNGGKADTHPTSDFTWTVGGVLDGVLAAGDNNVVVTYAGVQSDTIVVNGAVVHATSVAITEATAEVGVGLTTALHGSVEPANAIDAISWSSANNDIATVNDEGVVTGVAPGSVVITATANGHTDTCTVYVFERIDFADKSYNIKKPASASEDLSTVLVGNYTINLRNSYNDNNNGTTYAYLMFGCKDLSTGSTLASNKTPAPAPITKIVFTIKSGSAGEAVYKASLSSTEVTANVTSDTNKRTGAGTLEITANAEANMRYFAISSTNSSKNGQLESIDIYYAKPTAKAAINSIKTRSTLAYKYNTSPSLSFSGVAMRFGGLVSKSLWNELNAQNGGSNIEGYGILLSTPGYLESAKLETKYEAVDGNNVKKFDHAVATLPDDANVSQKNGLLEGYYVWNLFKDVTVNPAAEFTSVAYIRTKTEVVFFDETTKSAKQLAIELLATDEFDDDSLDGSMYSLAHWGE